MVRSRFNDFRAITILSLAFCFLIVICPKSFGNMVLLTTDEFTDRASVLSFINWQSTRGVDVNLLSIGDVRESATGRDDAEKILNYLKNRLTAWDIQYLLILGTTREIPTRYCHVFGPLVTNETPSQFIVATDSYYGDMTGDWDSDSDGYFGEFHDDDVNMIPEVVVGRIPEASPEWVDSILEKIKNYSFNYEQPKNLIFQVGGIQYYPEENGCQVIPGFDTAVLQEQLWEDSLKDLNLGLSRYRFYEKSGLLPSEEFSEQAWTANDLEQQWESQVPGFVFISSHGSQNSLWRKLWYEDDLDGFPESSPNHDILYDEMRWLSGFRASGSGTGANTFGLKEQNPAFVVATGSSAAWVEGYNLGKGLLRRGGIGFVGASRPVSNLPTWSSPTDSGFSSLCYNYCRAIFEEGKSFGTTLSTAKLRYIRDREQLSVADYINLLSLQLVGDPSIRYSEVWSMDRYYDLALSAIESETQNLLLKKASGNSPEAKPPAEKKPLASAKLPKEPPAENRILQVDPYIEINPHIGFPNSTANLYFEDFARFDQISVYWDGTFWGNTFNADAAGSVDWDSPIPENQIPGLHLVEGSSLIGASYWDSAAYVIRSSLVHPSLDIMQESAQPGEWIDIDIGGFVPGDFLFIYVNDLYYKTTDVPLSSSGALRLSLQVPLDAEIGEDMVITAIEGSADVEGLHWADDIIQIGLLAKPVFRLSEEPLKTGQPFTLQGGGFPKDVTVALSLNSLPVGTILLDSTGTFIESVTVPLSLGPGEYVLQASVSGQSVIRTVQVTSDLRILPGTDIPLSVLLKNLGDRSVDTTVLFELTASSGSVQAASSSLRAIAQRGVEVTARFNFEVYENYLLTVTAPGPKDHFMNDNKMVLSVSAAPGWDTNADGVSEPEELFLLGRQWSENYTADDLLNLIRRWNIDS